MNRGVGKRCSGYLSDDGAWAHCTTREEHAGHLPPTSAEPPTFAHRLEGKCRCGETHGLAWIDRPATSTRREIVAVYEYVDETGRPLFEVVRYEPKHSL